MGLLCLVLPAPPMFSQLILAAAALGLVAYGGNEYAQGRPFLSPSVASGPVPAAVMAVLGAFTWSAFHVVMQDGKRALDDWL